jgi:hypothetical protein
VKPEVQYLVHVISRDEVIVSPDKVKAVRDYSTPKNVKDVRAFIGLVPFYRRLIPKFADIAKPLAELTRKDSLFQCGERQITAFQALKDAFCSSDVLAYPDFTTPFTLTTDASRVSVAAVVSQVQTGVDRPINYASRQLNRAEQNYSASELEILAVIWSLRQFRCYLYGRHFTIRTDHAALTYLHKFSGNNARLLRWSLRLAEYDFTVQYRPGTKIPHVDSLSRYICAVSSNETLSKERVKQAQASGVFCRTLSPGRQNSRSEYFTDLEGVMYKRRQGKEPVLVVPRSLIREMISLNHD